MDKILSVLQEIAPLELADHSWDNVGLIVDANEIKMDNELEKKIILLTNDLTSKVVEEAIQLRDVFLIISYHPPILSPIRIFNEKTTGTIMKCIKNKISVYCPHTALDSVLGGINDWISSIFEYNHIEPIVKSGKEDGTGFGRYINLKNEITVDNVLFLLSKLFETKYMRFSGRKNKKISSIGICPGSGGSLFQKIEKQVDCVITGEMSYHHILKHTRQDTVVVLCEHDVSERNYLKTKMHSSLSEKFPNIKILCSKEDKSAVETILIK